MIRKLSSSFLLVLSFASAPASALVTYDFLGVCGNDCDPHGVVGTPVDEVTGSLLLDLPALPGTQAWSLGDVNSFVFTIGDFTIDDSNATLQTAGITPFVSTPDAPFADEDGFLVAILDADPLVSFVIARGGVNLVQPFEPGCAQNDCQTIALGDYTRIPPVPVPAALPLLGSALFGLIALGRRRYGSASPR